MPFKSEKQRRWMWANEPEMAEKWEEEEKNEGKIMKITRRQLRNIIRESLHEGYNSMSSAGKAHANAVKRKFMKLYPDAKVGIDGREGWITVNGKKVINMSQASGRPLTDEEMIDKMHTAYAGESVDSDVPTASSSSDSWRMEERIMKTTRKQRTRRM